VVADEGQVPLDEAVGAGATHGGQADAVVHRDGSLATLFGRKTWLTEV
jgi:hypothetical protein